MKKLIFLTLFVIFGVQFSFAVVGSENAELKRTNTTSVSDKVCGGFTQKEMTTLKALSFVLGAQGDNLDRKASDFEKSEEYKIATEQREILIEELKKTIKCDGKYKNYDDFKKGILSYVVKLNNLRKTQEEKFLSKYSEADNIMMKAQQKLLFAGKDGFEIMKGIFNEKTEHNIKLEVGDKDAKQMFFPSFKLNAGILSDGFFDLYNKRFDLDFGLSGAVEIWIKNYDYNKYENIFQEYKLGGDIQSSIKLSKDAIYMMLKKFDVKVSPLDDSQLQDFVEFREKLKNITDKRIKVPLDFTKRKEVVQITKSFDKMLAIQTLYSNSLLQFLYKEGDTYYAVPSVNICKLFDDYQKESCFDAIMEAKEKSSKKGFITLKVNGSNYELGLSPKFVSKDKEGFEDTMGFLTKKPILTWNDIELQTITVPFGEEGQNGLFVKDKKINVIYKNDREYSPVDLVLDGVYDNNGVDMKGSGDFEGMKVDFDFSFSRKGDKYSSDIKFDVKDENGKHMGKFEYNVSKVVKEVSNYKFTYPKDEDVLTMEELENLVKDTY